MSKAVRYDLDSDGIATVLLDDPEASVNTMNARYMSAMREAVEALAGDVEAGRVDGVIVASAKKTFFAGGDLAMLRDLKPADAPEFFQHIEAIKTQLRRLETLGRPVVAAINGSALGGGLEIALACHHRIAVEASSTKLGFPEVQLGLLPGGGGVTRTVRMLGLQDALMNWLLQGQQRSPQEAARYGLVDELVPTQNDLLPAARAWITAHRDDAGAASQLWDQKGYRMPGGTPNSPKLAAMLPAFPANLRKQLKGADYPAPRAIMAAAFEGAQVDFETASRIESRYFTQLACGPDSKNMIQAFFFDLQALTSGSLRPVGVEKRTVSRVGVLGAGMMGAGIAYACATRGIEVVLKDVSEAGALKGKDHTAALLAKKVDRGAMSQQSCDEILARITPTAETADLAACDAVIEAVFEDAELKAKVFKQAEEVLDETALLCSNTSTLPITELATNVQRSSDFVGLHFFSPVDKMRLVEVIRGEQTSDETLARALDLVDQIGKVPIVVNDSRGFFTSRVFGTYILEGAAMLSEGLDPMSVERAGTMAGFASGPLTLLDEVSLTLPQHIRDEAARAATARGDAPTQQAGMDVVDEMVGTHQRAGRAAGGGFYDYPAGEKKRLWPELRATFAQPGADIPMRDMQDRFRFVMALETAKCFEEGVIESAAAANIGSIFGIGFPPMTGGVAQFITAYPGGLPGFVDRAKELAAAYGERFEPSAWLVERAAKGMGLTNE